MFTYRVEIAASPDGPLEAVDAHVDSGAVYTPAPGSFLKDLGVQPIDTATFVTADGRCSEPELGEVVLRIDGRTRRSICVFGEEGTPPLLGAYAREGFLLDVDPVNKRLVPVEGIRLGRPQVQGGVRLQVTAMRVFIKVKQLGQARASAGWNKHVNRFQKRIGNKSIRRVSRDEIAPLP